MKLIKRGDKYLICRGILFKEYLDMTGQENYFWWSSEPYVENYCFAPSKEHALARLREYREDKINKSSKTIKWFV
jgi:uncharacterized protein YcaQ